MGRRFEFITGLSEMARSKSSLCVKSFWFILLISKPPLFIGGIWMCVSREHRWSLARPAPLRDGVFQPNTCLFSQCLLPSGVTVIALLILLQRLDSAAEKLWHCKALFTCESIIMFWISVIHLLCWKWHYIIKLLLDFRALRRSCFLSLTPCDSAGKCFTLCISVVPFYELWVAAGKYKRAWRSCFWCS